MLLRHMCLRTGVELGQFLLPFVIRADMGLGVPSSEKLMRVM